MKSFWERFAKRIALIATAVSVLGHAAAWFLLPKTLVLQVTAEGPSGNVLPSWAFLSLMALLEGVIWNVAARVQEENRGKWLGVSGIVLFVDILSIVLNCVGFQNLL